MMAVGLVDAARLASLASGRGGVPEPGEWPIVLLLLVALAFLGTRILVSFGLTRVEALLVAALSPLLVLIDAPLGRVSDDAHLAANAAGCLIPLAVATKVVLERRVPWGETLVLIAVSVVVSYFSSRVIPEEGVMLQYRVPAFVLGLLSAGLLFRVPERSGSGAFAAGVFGVVIGADLFHLAELAEGGGRVILGGAGLLDGILLVAVLGAAVGELVSVALRGLTRVRTPSEPTV